MRCLVLAALVAAVACMNLKEDNVEFAIGKVTLLDKDVNVKTICIMKLLNQITQPTMYDDIREVARDYKLEENTDKYLKAEVVKTFLRMYNVGMLPRGEIFTYTSHKQMDEAIKVFHLLYYANDLDTFVKTACWLRERINPGMFVYAVTVAVMHRADCRGVVLPAPYEIYPYFFVDSDVIHKAYTMKMKRGLLDSRLMDYYGIKVTDKNVVVIDSRKTLRHVLSEDDRLTYFTEDIDLNTYYYYFLMDYPFWMTGTTNSISEINKERYGEMSLYMMQQLLARYNLERRSHNMCDAKMLMWDMPLKTGYWPKIRLHNGEEMPTRMNNQRLVTDENIRYYRLTRDYERRIRDAITSGHLHLRDGTKIDMKKPEDIEILGRLIMGNLDHDDAEFFRAMFVLLRTAMGYDVDYKDRYTYTPSVIDELQTSLRDPLYWKLMKRLVDNMVIFKKLLPSYTQDQFDFPGIKIESLTTDKLMTFVDDYDMDINNALFLDDAEFKKQKMDHLFVARQRRLNHHPFKVTIDVISDKTVDAVVRVFLGPKHDCMGALLNMEERRHNMVELDTFLYKLQTGKNTIVRDSRDIHQVINDRTWSRKIWDKSYTRDTLSMDTTYVGADETHTQENYWYKSRLGFPHRLLLPMGHKGGLEMQLYVIVSPVRTGMNLNNMFDMEVMKKRGACRWSVCFDTMPLGYPFDREIDVSRFFTDNMKFIDVAIYHKDLDVLNSVKGVDLADMVMKRDDLTYTMDKDLLVKNRMMEMGNMIDI